MAVDVSKSLSYLGAGYNNVILFGLCDDDEFMLILMLGGMI